MSQRFTNFGCAKLHLPSQPSTPTHSRQSRNVWAGRHLSIGLKQSPTNFAFSKLICIWCSPTSMSRLEWKLDTSSSSTSMVSFHWHNTWYHNSTRTALSLRMSWFKLFGWFPPRRVSNSTSFCRHMLSSPSNPILTLFASLRSMILHVDPPSLALELLDCPLWCAHFNFLLPSVRLELLQRCFCSELLRRSSPLLLVQLLVLHLHLQYPLALASSEHSCPRMSSFCLHQSSVSTAFHDYAPPFVTVSHTRIGTSEYERTHFRNLASCPIFEQRLQDDLACLLSVVGDPTANCQLKPPICFPPRVLRKSFRAA